MPFPLNEELSEGVADLAFSGQTSGTTAVSSPAISMRAVRKAKAVIGSIGTLAASEVITGQWYGCATSGGTYAALSGTSVTLSKSPTDQSGKAVGSEITSQWLAQYNAANGTSYAYLKFQASCSVGSAFALYAYGASGPNEPVSANNAAAFLTPTVNAY